MALRQADSMQQINDAARYAVHKSHSDKYKVTQTSAVNCIASVARCMLSCTDDSPRCHDGSKTCLGCAPRAVVGAIKGSRGFCLFSIDKNQVSQIVTRTRNFKVPERHKGKGITTARVILHRETINETTSVWNREPWSWRQLLCLPFHSHCKHW